MPDMVADLTAKLERLRHLKSLAENRYRLAVREDVPAWRQEQHRARAMRHQMEIEKIEQYLLVQKNNSTEGLLAELTRASECVMQGDLKGARYAVMQAAVKLQLRVY